jgi:hypothetical protein
MGIYPEGWPVLRLFLALSTQWRRAGLDGAITGMDRTAISPTAALMGIALSGDQGCWLLAMESAALTELLKQQERAARRRH